MTIETNSLKKKKNVFDYVPNTITIELCFAILPRKSCFFFKILRFIFQGLGVLESVASVD